VLLGFVQANSLLVLFAVIYVYIAYGTGFLDDIVDNFFKYDIPIYATIAIDLVAHWLPVLVFGLPIGIPAWLALLPIVTILVWYAIVRRRIANIYKSPSVNMIVTDRIIIGAILSYAATLLVLKVFV
jgi:hypothetical protein